MKKTIHFLTFVMICNMLTAQQNSKFLGKTIHFKSEDGVKITADLYMSNKKNAPFIILYHQARYSRGEYRAIAPKLNSLGFNCLAVDQRSGDKVNGVVNQTHLEAVKLNKGTQYVDAIPDLKAAFDYVKNTVQPGKIIIWGSSYSSALVFYLASLHPDDVAGVLSFSPGEYFKIEGKGIKSYAAKVNCPVFITSSGKEHEQWKGIYATLPGEKFSFLPKTEEGRHGSKALWDDNGNHEKYWKAVEVFLMKFK